MPKAYEILNQIGEGLAEANGAEWTPSVTSQPTPPTKGPSI
tara:strand:- start:340 stop:462 length:123 start_codon:yes stop_codon:yes gene_type:complete